MSAKNQPEDETPLMDEALAQEMLRLQQRNAELERRLAEMEALLRVLPVGIGIAEDPACQRIRINPAFAQMLNLPEGANASLTAPDEERPSTFRVLSHGIEVDPNRLPMQTAAREGIEVRDFELDIVHDDGAVVNLLEYAEPLYDEQGRVRGSLGVFVDITDRIQAEEELRASEARARTLVENAPETIVVLDVDTGRFVDVNENATRMFGMAREQLLTIGPIELSPPIQPDGRPSAAAAMEVIQEALEGGTPVFEWMHRNAANEAIPCEIRLVRLPSTGQRLVRGSLTDITERQRMAEARERLEQERDRLLERLQLHIERMPIGYLLSDAQLRYVDWNPAAERIFGYTREEVLGKHPFEVIVPPSSQEYTSSLFDRLMAGDMNAHGIGENITRDGRLILCEWLNTPLMNADGSFGGLLSMAQDITEKHRLEEQLNQAQKMESIGRLAGGVAHDFNNILTAILGYTELAEAEMSPNLPAYGFLQNVRTAGERATALTRQLLAFARKQIIAPKVLRLNDLILDVSRLLRRLIGEHIELVVLPTHNLHSVRVDPGQMEQVLINLVVNARDAMPHGGKITIETHNVVLDEVYARQRPEVTPGPYALLAISDTGGGIAPEIQSHIFEPFFTTKEIGKGTGLGLATCYGIVKQNGGHIWVYSEPGQGTSFKIYLPCTEEESLPSSPPEILSTLPHGSETILLVEDEELVRGIAAQTLRTQGYRVVEASNGSEALRLAQEMTGEIHLLITDVVMPQMGGAELAQRLQALRPVMKILFTSGYTDNAIVHHGRLDPGVHFLSKPFMPVAFAHKVRAVLDAPAPGKKDSRAM
ncbi:MAG TPA: PAS domain S-box protein [Chthonomonadaceae bacterium]|nr:PAS domain S-box protein [Chthonomonadaceae bacterium]